VIGRIADDALGLDLRCLGEHEEEEFRDALATLAAS
jgi:hypothetical protein